MAGSREKCPELGDRFEKAAEDPMNHMLEILVRAEPKKTRGRGRREAGRKRNPMLPVKLFARFVRRWGSSSEAFAQKPCFAPNMRFHVAPKTLSNGSHLRHHYSGRSQVAGEMKHFECLPFTADGPLC